MYSLMVSTISERGEKDVEKVMEVVVEEEGEEEDMEKESGRSSPISRYSASVNLPASTGVGSVMTGTPIAKACSAAW